MDAAGRTCGAAVRVWTAARQAAAALLPVPLPLVEEVDDELEEDSFDDDDDDDEEEEEDDSLDEDDESEDEALAGSLAFEPERLSVR